MKKLFEEPAVEVLTFNVDDIITNSGDPVGGPDDGPIITG